MIQYEDTNDMARIALTSGMEFSLKKNLKWQKTLQAQLT